jgi:hypothetical protein
MKMADNNIRPNSGKKALMLCMLPVYFIVASDNDWSVVAKT